MYILIVRCYQLINTLNLKKYDNLVGNYGNAWWDQIKTFGPFNGPILFTTNCIVPPKKDAEYKNIHIGPTLPVFLSPNVANFLIETFNLGTISTVEEDIKKIIG